jgi:hypothetical protein
MKSHYIMGSNAPFTAPSDDEALHRTSLGKSG